MSIGIATICTDGLVICAERQISHGDFKHYESKLSKIALTPCKGTVVLGYAGSPDAQKVIVEALRGRWENQDKSHEQIGNDLREVLDANLPKGKTKDVHQVLCGFYESGTFYLFKSYNRAISPVPVWDCVGFGDSALTRYLGSIFLEGTIHLPLSRAVPICIYLVAQAKKYVEGCGGETDIVVLKPQGKVIEHAAGTKYDAACAMVEAWLNGILTSATEPNVSTEKVQRLIEALRNVLDAQTGLMTGFLVTSDCIECGKEYVSSEPGAKFCGSCKRWACATCLEKHGQRHVLDQAAGEPL